MKSLFKTLIVTFFLTFSYSSLAENNNITTDTNKKLTNKCFISFENPNKCTVINTPIHNFPDA